MKVISSEIVPVDMEFAFEWVNKPFAHQRPTNISTVNKYKMDMATGRWNLGEGQIVIGVRESGSYLVAGKHRLTAVFELGNIVVPMRVTFIQFDTDGEMASFYALGTNQGRVMSTGTALEVLGTADAIGIPPSYGQKYAAAIILIANNFETRYSDAKGNAMHVRSPEALDRCLRYLKGAVYGYHRSLDGSSSSGRLVHTRAAVISVGLMAFHFQPEKAIEFWSRVASNDGLRKGEPEHTLYNFLAQNEVAGTDIFEYTCSIACCWNSFMDGNSRSVIRPSSAKGNKGIIVKGTPWNGSGEADPLYILGVKGSAK